MASYAIQGKVLHVRQRLLRIPMVEVGIAVIAEAELRFGVARKPGHSRLETAVEKFLLRVEILRWDSAAAKYYITPPRSRTDRRPDGKSGHDDRGPSPVRSGDAGQA